MSLIKRFSLVSYCVSLFCLSASAYDTQGKFGMGIRLQGTPIITFSTMKYGISNSLGIEPSIGYYEFQTKVTGLDYVYDQITGREDSVEVTDKMTNSLFMLSGIADLKPIRAEKSNFVVRAGGSYGAIVTKMDTDDPDVIDDDYENTVHMFSIQGGFGIEHFFTDHFSVNVGILASLWFFNNTDEDSDYTTQVSAKNLGNQLADFALVWYLK